MTSCFHVSSHFSKHILTQKKKHFLNNVNLNRKSRAKSIITFCHFISELCIPWASTPLSPSTAVADSLRSIKPEWKGGFT